MQQGETEPDLQVYQVHLDHRDKSSIRRQIMVDPVYLDKLDFLVLLAQRVTKEIPVFQVTA